MALMRSGHPRQHRNTACNDSPDRTFAGERAISCCRALCRFSVSRVVQISLVVVTRALQEMVTPLWHVHMLKAQVDANTILWVPVRCYEV